MNVPTRHVRRSRAPLSRRPQLGFQGSNGAESWLRHYRRGGRLSAGACYAPFVTSLAPDLRRIRPHGWLGLALVTVCWPLLWSPISLPLGAEAPGEYSRTQVLFFPLWLGYILAVDAATAWRSGTSQLVGSQRRFVALFFMSIPSWWLFELLNLRTENWTYLGIHDMHPAQYALLASVSFSTVIPAVFGTAELLRTFQPFRDRAPHLAARPADGLDAAVAATGAVMLGLLLAWPRLFYPFLWLSIVFLLEPLNHVIGARSLLGELRASAWRFAASLAAGVLVCGFCWELWNWRANPKWVYDVPFFGFWHVFEMPLPGYLGYIPFAFELFALVSLVDRIGSFARTRPAQ